MAECAQHDNAHMTSRTFTWVASGPLGRLAALTSSVGRKQGAEGVQQGCTQAASSLHQRQLTWASSGPTGRLAPPTSSMGRRQWLKVCSALTSWCAALRETSASWKRLTTSGSTLSGATKAAATSALQAVPRSVRSCSAAGQVYGRAEDRRVNVVCESTPEALDHQRQLCGRNCSDCAGHKAAG